MAALTWSENLVPIAASELQPYAETTTYSTPMKSTHSIARGCIMEDWDPEKPEVSYIQYLNRCFGFPHTSPDTMNESDFEFAYATMALYSPCKHCATIYKSDKRYTAHLQSFKINGIEEHLCPQHPSITKSQHDQALFNCILCKKNFADSKRPKKQLGQHLKTKGHMAKVNTELEHCEHQRLCDLVGISVD